MYFQNLRTILFYSRIRFVYFSNEIQSTNKCFILQVWHIILNRRGFFKNRNLFPNLKFLMCFCMFYHFLKYLVPLNGCVRCPGKITLELKLRFPNWLLIGWCPFGKVPLKWLKVFVPFALYVKFWAALTNAANAMNRITTIAFMMKQ